jgi:hypothetical protein
MKISAGEILKYLGLNVPKEGLEISSEDAFLFTSCLTLLKDSLFFT